MSGPKSRHNVSFQFKEKGDEYYTSKVKYSLWQFKFGIGTKKSLYSLPSQTISG